MEIYVQRQTFIHSYLHVQCSVYLFVITFIFHGEHLSSIYLSPFACTHSTHICICTLAMIPLKIISKAFHHSHPKSLKKTNTRMNDAKTWVAIFHCQPLFFALFKRLIKRIAFYSLIKGSNSMSLLLSAVFFLFFLFTSSILFLLSFQCVTFFTSSFHFSRSMMRTAAATLCTATTK